MFRQIYRPTVTHLTLNLLISIYILALNQGFWRRLQDQFALSDTRFWVFGLVALALMVLLLELFGPERLQKPVGAIFIIIAASAGYYERNFGVLIDRDMVRNIFETTPAESRHLVNLHMIGVIALTGVLPAILVFWPRVKRVSLPHWLWRWPLGVALCFALMSGGLFTHYRDYSAMLRERHDLLGSYQPGASLVAASRYAREQWKTADPVAVAYGRDARKLPHGAEDKPLLLVLLVGETARAESFGLTGGARDTTPELAKRDVIAFQDVTACGTSTAVSVPCMFSGLGQANYSREAALGRENLADILKQSGFDVEWWDNNTGDQKVAKRIGSNFIDAKLTPAVCVEECTDEAFLPLIEKKAATITKDTVLILHMIGSHGPAYSLRYPRERAAFTPDCQSSQFSDCSADEIHNAYDNSIRETDYVLAQTIDLLEKADKVTPAMIYLSDHGESLGENGLYLHAAPHFMAPPEQAKVPMVWWLSPRFSQAMQLQPACLAAKAESALSHDNLFSSVLGLLNVETKVKDQALDLTSGCRLAQQA